ncbi:replication protein A 32 kDa subunit [Ischnura elegans]|uniref:replication protein A 32 kDa subunit n=1 Tax=Ischnura elegans TaxID=197161 RepID=UPI001ED8A728|nr:replication protein A 32 kDa subunit [Ischnura elegans]
MDDGNNFRNAAGFYSASKTDSPSGDQNKDARRQRNVVPVTISQILQGGDDGLKIGETQVHLATLVGVVKSVEISSTKITYVIQDDTGSISASIFIESGDGNDASNQPVVENSYYRLIGSIRMVHEKPFVMVLKIMPLCELNELTTHLLEVIHTTVKSEQLMKKKESDTFHNTNNTALPNSLMGASFDNRNSNAMPGYGATGGLMNGFTPQQQLVYSAIQTCIEGTGIHKSAIANSIRGRVSPKEIENILEFLSNEGHIYSTIDEEHFKTTDSC